MNRSGSTGPRWGHRLGTSLADSSLLIVPSARTGPADGTAARPLRAAVPGVRPPGDPAGRSVALLMAIRDESGRPLGPMQRVRDITGREAAGARARGAARRETRLKETHRRIEDNLQVGSPLLCLQATVVKDGGALAAHAESRVRVRSIAPVHEKLGCSPDPGRLAFADHLRDLLPEMMRAHGVRRGRIVPRADIEGFHLGIDTAVPCGLSAGPQVAGPRTGRRPGQAASGAASRSMTRPRRPSRSPSRTPAPRKEAEPMNAPRILVVDEMIIARELESRLEHLGYEVAGIAPTGAEAIELAEATRPDLVLMDIALRGGMDGIDAATEIRSRRPVPIIYVTAHTDDRTLRRARVTEPFGFIVKPFSGRELRSNIEMALYKHGVDERLRRVEARFAAAMERVAEGVVAADRHGIVTYINAEAQALTGWRGGEAVGEELGEVVRLVRRADQAPLGDIVRRALAEGLVTHRSDETRLAGRRATVRDVDVTAARVRGDGAADSGGVVVVLRDRSERNRLRQSLRESEAELRRNDEALRDADRRKDEFLATLAHELRNPLATVRNGLQILRGARGEAGEATRAMMERQLAHLVRLVDDLIDVSRVSRGRIELKCERIRLDELLDAAVEASRPFIQAAGHQLATTIPEGPAWLDGDLVRLSQVISNLLNNAAKYTPADGRISLAAAIEGAQVAIRVVDNGAGISAEMLPAVFDMFTQGDRALDRAQGGLGVGLCLVKQIAEMHGATVEAASPGVGLGSVFTVRLPIAAPPDAPGAAGEPAGGGDSSGDRPGLRVLVVDDNIDSARTLAMLLEIWQYSTRVAHDGPAAIAIAAEFQPDLVFLDIGLPGMDGHEVGRRLRTFPSLSATLLVALTGWGSETDKMRTRDAGFHLHLVKPVDPDEIQAILRRTTAARREVRA